MSHPNSSANEAVDDEASPAMVAATSSGGDTDRLLVKEASVFENGPFPSDADLGCDIDQYASTLNPTTATEIARSPPDVVVFVVNRDEWQAALRFFKPYGKATIGVFRCYMCTCPALTLGPNSKSARVLLAQSKTTGSSTAQGLITSILSAGIGPRLFVAAGCAFGFNEKKQRMHDVLLSESVLSYEMVRKQDDGEKATDIDRNEPVKMAPNIYKVLQDCADGWRFGSNRAHPGIILCGDKLVDSQLFMKYVEDVLAINSKGEIKKIPVVGGEMEGRGMAASFAFHQSGHIVPWVVIKGVSDHARGEKDRPAANQADEAAIPVAVEADLPNIGQRKATFAAISLLLYMLKEMNDMKSLDSHLGFVVPANALAKMRSRLTLPSTNPAYKTCVELIFAFQTAEVARAEIQEYEKAKLVRTSAEQAALSGNQGYQDSLKKLALLKANIIGRLGPFGQAPSNAALTTYTSKESSMKKLANWEKQFPDVNEVELVLPDASKWVIHRNEKQEVKLLLGRTENAPGVTQEIWAHIRKANTVVAKVELLVQEVKPMSAKKKKPSKKRKGEGQSQSQTDIDTQPCDDDEDAITQMSEDTSERVLDQTPAAATSSGSGVKRQKLAKSADKSGAQDDNVFVAPSPVPAKTKSGARAVREMGPVEDGWTLGDSKVVHSFRIAADNSTVEFKVKSGQTLKEYTRTVSEEDLETCTAGNTGLTSLWSKVSKASTSSVA